MQKGLFIIVLGILFARCTKIDDSGALQVYSFKTEVSPDYNADTIRAGDTLWFNSEIYGSLTDSASNKKVFFKDALINLNLVVRCWNKENHGYQPDNYDIVYTNSTIVGSESYTQNATMVALYYTKKESVYSLRFGVVFNVAGVYSVDSDYLKFLSYQNSDVSYFGGGYMQLYDIDGTYAEAVVKTEMLADNRNMALYNNLQEGDRGDFQDIDDTNSYKYFFIKVLE